MGPSKGSWGVGDADLEVGVRLRLFHRGLDEGEVLELSMAHVRKKHGQTVSVEGVKTKIKAV